MKKKLFIYSSLLLISVIILSACVKTAISVTSIHTLSPSAENTTSPSLVTTVVPVASPLLTPTIFTVASPIATTQSMYPTPGIVRTQISLQDGMTMVYVPAGDFLMGSVAGEGEKDERPQNTVYLDAFWIDYSEVTNGRYMKCVNDGICKLPASNKSYSRSDYYGNSEYLDFPTIYVDWYQAKKYCIWAGKRLPTEAEWEKAARGSEGQIYPWGNENPDDKIVNYNRIIGDTNMVGSYPVGVSQYGALDMAGNVSEWVEDWYGEYLSSLYKTYNPQGPSTGDYRIIRGGSWIFSAYLIRSAERYWVSPYYTDDDTGFRCALSED